MGWSLTLAMAGCALLGGGEEVPYTAADLVAGYQQNFARLRTLRVQVRYTEQWTANQLKHWEKEAARLEQQATHAAADERAGLLVELEGARLRARDPLMGEPHYTLQDFWTDGVQFQQRVPIMAQGWSTPRRDGGLVADVGMASFRFPDGPAAGEKLALWFRDLLVVSYSTKAGFRSWQGQDRAGRLLGWTSAEAKGPIVAFPPLGRPPSAWGSVPGRGQWHIFDEFFALPLEEMRVAGTAALEGRTVYLLEHVKPAPLESCVPPHLLEKYRDRLKRFEVMRAWIDPAQGCLPLRMERTSKTLYQGKLLEPLPGAEKLKPGMVVEAVQIQALPGGAYYPVSCVIRNYSMDADWTGPIPTIEDVIERRAVAALQNVLNQETRWEVLKLEENMPIAEDFFALPFPKNTVYYDADQGRGLVTGTAQEYLDGAIGPPGEEIPHQGSARPTQRRWWPLACGGAVVLACVAWLVRARLKARGARVHAAQGG